MTTDGIEERIEAVRRRDRRFDRAAFEFVLDALDHTMVHLGKDRMTGEERHIGGRELLIGIRTLASEQFGPMAPVVLRRWGLRNTCDFGEIVFGLIEAGLLSRRAEDSRLDFADGFDFDSAFAESFRDRLMAISDSE